MSLEQAGIFLTGSILYALGFIIIFIGMVVVNNILHKFWKPVKMFTPDSWKSFNPPAMQHEPTMSETK